MSANSSDIIQIQTHCSFCFKKRFMAFANAFDMAYTIKRGLHVILSQPILLSMVTSSLSLFDMLAKLSTTT